MRTLGSMMIAIGILVAFGLSSLAVLQSATFNLWLVVPPIVGGTLLTLVGRIVQGESKEPSTRRRRPRFLR